MHEGLSYYQYINQPDSFWWAATKFIVRSLTTGGVLLLLVMGARCIFNH